MKIDVAGVGVDPITKIEAVKKIDDFVQSGKPHLIVTTYSEFVVFAHHDDKYKTVLNNAKLSLADGFGILWAAKFLSLPRKNWFITGLQVDYTLIRALFDKKYFKTIIPEVITGSRLIWDIAALAESRGYSLALVGGFDGVARRAGERLKEKYPNLKINLAVSPPHELGHQTAQEINMSNSDILLIAYSPPMQEKWLSDNLSYLNVKVAIGLGGTFDYLAGKRPPAPNFMHQMGLEWLWRLITQPYRIKRIWNAVPVFIWKVYKYKLASSNQ